jgi:hypothetical protein
MLRADHLFWDYNPHSIREIMAQMTVANCKVDLVSSNFQAADDASPRLTVEGDSSKGNFEDDSEGEEDVSSDEASSSGGSYDDEADDMEGSSDDSGTPGSTGKPIQRKKIPDEELLQNYRGPEQWKHLVTSPTVAASEILVCCATRPEGSDEGGAKSADKLVTNRCCMRNCFKYFRLGDTLNAGRSEPYFGTRYWMDTLPADLLVMWTESAGEVDERHLLPERNIFIPSSMELLPELQQPPLAVLSKASVPALVYAAEGMAVYHRYALLVPIIWSCVTCAAGLTSASHCRKLKFTLKFPPVV